MTGSAAAPVAAGLAVGILFIVVLFATVSAAQLPSASTNLIMNQYKHVNLTITGLKDSYNLHEPLDFSLNANGFDSMCNSWPDVTIADSTGNVTWAYSGVSLMLCDPDLLPPHNIHASWNVTQNVTAPAINQIGSYTLKATYYGKTVEQRFTVHGGDTIGRNNSTQVASISRIYPGGAQVQSCPFIPVRSFVNVVDSTGFRVYNTSSSSFSSSLLSTVGVVDYVIPAGRNGTITFTITRGGPPTIIGNSSDANLGFNIPEDQTYANDAIFEHQEDITVEQNITSWTVGQFGNETNVTFYQACYDLPSDAGGGTACYSGPFKEPPPKTITTSVLRFNHPGINVTFEPKDEVLGFNESATITAIFSIDSDAPQGTYWMQLPPGSCGGSPTFLFTVGDNPYNFSGDNLLIH